MNSVAIFYAIWSVESTESEHFKDCLTERLRLTQLHRLLLPSTRVAERNTCTMAWNSLSQDRGPEYRREEARVMMNMKQYLTPEELAVQREAEMKLRSKGRANSIVAASLPFLYRYFKSIRPVLTVGSVAASVGLYSLAHMSSVIIGIEQFRKDVLNSPDLPSDSALREAIQQNKSLYTVLIERNLVAPPRSKFQRGVVDNSDAGTRPKLLDEAPSNVFGLDDSRRPHFSGLDDSQRPNIETGTTFLQENSEMDAAPLSEKNVTYAELRARNRDRHNKSPRQEQSYMSKPTRYFWDEEKPKHVEPEARGMPMQPRDNFPQREHKQQPSRHKRTNKYGDLWEE
ncbi:uncharacterized protein LOC106174141 [Lingula anatina]|uniref:Uncharacterized protein LOC106174141 n=1 Tax=Lingula anatina TaxID=7574 RepID=A0A1S3JKV9_LINAN|nr:uncharacterized protein LOC106174141 [Lingula anatina]|eukprot:XP_013411012.1 uncharacterized protein LOC106174141 [Lingula anatina]